MEVAITKAISEFGVLVVLAGITLYNYVFAIRANAENLARTTKILESNGEILRELSNSQKNISTSLDIIKVVTDKIATIQSKHYELSGEIFDKTMCIKEGLGLVTPVVAEVEISRRERNG